MNDEYARKLTYFESAPFTRENINKIINTYLKNLHNQNAIAAPLKRIEKLESDENNGEIQD